MKSSSQIAVAPYDVEIIFFSGGDPYGTETYRVMAASWYQAEQDALARSVDSIYDNDRIPDLRRRACANGAL